MQKQEQSNEFQPDFAIKKFLTKLSTERFIGISNELRRNNQKALRGGEWI